MARPKFGDIIEIETTHGLAYALYTHKHTEAPRYGALLRVFERLYSSRPDSLEEIVTDKVRFSTFFPLGAAVNQGIFKVIGNVAVPQQLQKFPIFRNGMPDPKTKKVKVWWLWDGEKEVRVGELTPEERHYPFLSVVNDTMLIHRIENDWRPENDPR